VENEMSTKMSGDLSFAFEAPFALFTAFADLDEKLVHKGG